MEAKNYENILKEKFPEMYKLTTEQRWHIKGGEYHPDAFGNALVDIESRDFNIRITKDRSQIFIYVSRPGSSRWHDIETLLGHVPDSYSFSEDTLVNLLEGNLQNIPGLLRNMK